MRTVPRVLAVAATTAALSMPAAAAVAATPSGAEGFGQHVVACAQGTGHDGAHNPGMHQGASGWDGQACP